MKRTFSALVISGALLCTPCGPRYGSGSRRSAWSFRRRLCTSGPDSPGQRAVLWTSDPGRSG